MPNSPDRMCQRLMARFQDRGDVEAFEQIVSRLLAPAVGVARQLLGCPALAEDAVQEAFLRVVRHQHRYRPSEPFTNWFYTILRNVCRDVLRRRARQHGLVRNLSRHTPEYADPPDDGEADAWALLRRLPAGERDVLVLRIGHDLPFRDVGAALGISEEAAKKRAQRGLRRLRQYTLAPASLPQGR